ncbi:MAG TPA: hypothetical protein PLP17_03995, partial [Oligoflexia bacterium]|nr:hypothetical protein [Oligoflexia bacterium]
SAVVPLGDTPNVDILCSNRERSRFVRTQVKTFIPGKRTCSVGVKTKREIGPSSFWILAGMPLPASSRPFEYYIIPSKVMSQKISQAHGHWLKMPGANGQAHRESTVRIVHLPTGKCSDRWDISPYLNKWKLIEDKPRTKTSI